MRHAPTLLLALVSASASGCFRLQPSAPASTPIGADVRITLRPYTDESTLERFFGPGVRVATGQIAELLADTAVVLVADAVVGADGDEIAWRRGRVAIPTRVIQGMERRALDRRRTRMFAVVAAATFTAIIISAIRSAGSSGRSSGGSGSGPPD